MSGRRAGVRQHGASATASLRAAQTLTSLAVPAFGRGSSLLQHVPENDEMDLRAPSPVPHPREIFRNEDWNSLQKAVKSLFEGSDPLSIPGELNRLHQNVKNILKSKTGTFLSDYYKQELLAKGMVILTEKLLHVRGSLLLKRMEDVWNTFFTHILPTLEAILYLVKPKCRLTIRRTTLAAFRDVVFFSIDIEGAIRNALASKEEIYPGIRHMLLVLQVNKEDVGTVFRILCKNVNDCYPPNKNKLRLEAIVALIVVPYLGFLGLYEGGAKPVIESSEPMLASRRRSSADVGGPRRISRPFSVQPLEMDTLNKMFLNAIRNKQEL